MYITIEKNSNWQILLKANKHVNDNKNSRYCLIRINHENQIFIVYYNYNYRFLELLL